MLSFEDVMVAIRDEMAYQDDKWGADKQQSLPGYMTVMRRAIGQAEDAWCTNSGTYRDTPLAEVLKCVAVGVRTLQAYGVSGSAFATNDISQDEYQDSQLGDLMIPDQFVPPRYGDRESRKIITLTLTAGTPIHIGKAVYVRCQPSANAGLTIVVTRNGSVEVRESIRVIQSMMQD